MRSPDFTPQLRVKVYMYMHVTYKHHDNNHPQEELLQASSGKAPSNWCGIVNHKSNLKLPGKNLSVSQALKYIFKAFFMSRSRVKVFLMWVYVTGLEPCLPPGK